MGKDITYHNSAIGKLSVERMAINQRIADARKLGATDLCPFAIGDVIINDKGQKEKIVDFIDFSCTGTWFVIRATRILKTSGKDGVTRKATIYLEDNWRLA